jgi:hypothetical protein
MPHLKCVLRLYSEAPIVLEALRAERTSLFPTDELFGSRNWPPTSPLILQ